MREATFIEEWLEEKLEEGLHQGLHQGLEQGLEQGLHQGALRQLLRVLEHRFGRVSPGVEAKLRMLDAVRLETLLDVALDADSLEEFLGALL